MSHALVRRLLVPLWFAVCLPLTGACAATSSTRQAVLTPTAMPHDAEGRRGSLKALGQRLFDALRFGNVRQSLVSGRELEELVSTESRMRIEREQQHQLVPSTFRSNWASASYDGFCAQGAREEPAHNGLGLMSPGWVLERILIVARDGAGRSASWIEGRFVYTGQGWKTLSLTRIEQPRRQHSDLDLAPCDVEEGLR